MYKFTIISLLNKIKSNTLYFLKKLCVDVHFIKVKRKKKEKEKKSKKKKKRKKKEANMITEKEKIKGKRKKKVNTLEVESNVRGIFGSSFHELLP